MIIQQTGLGSVDFGFLSFTHVDSMIGMGVIVFSAFVYIVSAVAVGVVIVHLLDDGGWRYYGVLGYIIVALVSLLFPVSVPLIFMGWLIFKLVDSLTS